MPFRKSSKQAELEEYARQEAELRAKIEEIQGFIKEAPEKLQREEEERMQTLPAPDELAHIQREKDFIDRLTKGEIRNERRHQARSAVLFILLAAAIIFVSLWIYKEISNAI